MGSSAGSILVTPTIATAANGDKNIVRLKDVASVGLVDFELLPHVPYDISLAAAEAYAKTTKRTFYALDDQSALSVEDGQVQVVSEGSWHVWNE